MHLNFAKACPVQLCPVEDVHLLSQTVKSRHSRQRDVVFVSSGRVAQLLCGTPIAWSVVPPFVTIPAQEFKMKFIANQCYRRKLFVADR